MSLRVLEKDLELVDIDSGGSEILYYRGKPFTGIMIDYDTENNIEYLCMEIEFQNGYREGMTKYFHSNGQLENEYYLHNNEVKSGTYKEYDENGKLTRSF